MPQWAVYGGQVGGTPVNNKFLNNKLRWYRLSFISVNNAYRSSFGPILWFIIKFYGKLVKNGLQEINISIIRLI